MFNKNKTDTFIFKRSYFIAVNHNCISYDVGLAHVYGFYSKDEKEKNQV